MPAGDGTGPMGYGPMTGRAAGYCAGYQVPGYMNPMAGRYWGRGRGWFGRGGGRGWRHWFYATGLPGWARTGYGAPLSGPPVMPYPPDPTPEEELKVLKDQAEFIKTQLDEIQQRIRTLENAEVKTKE